MPDIGLLQGGPPLPRVPPATPPTPPGPAPVDDSRDDSNDVRVVAHAAVVSAVERPVAIVTAAMEPAQPVEKIGAADHTEKAHPPAAPASRARDLLWLGLALLLIVATGLGVRDP